ncbi:hypothetical protein Patl1_35615 [Pistacia atlantica]|nr:hypothetical protein Patl1_35615 [Pistacia atlantica]
MAHAGSHFTQPSVASLTEEIMAKVVNCTTARDAWLALEIAASSFANLVPKALTMSFFSRSMPGFFFSIAMVVQRGASTEWQTAKKCHKLGKLLKKAKADGLIEAFAATSLDDSQDTECPFSTSVTPASSSASTPCVPCADSSLIIMPPITLSQPSSPELALNVPPPASSSTIQPSTSTSTHPMITRARDGIVKPRIIHSLYAFTAPPWFQLADVFTKAVAKLQFLLDRGKLCIFPLSTTPTLRGDIRGQSNSSDYDQDISDSPQL